MFHVSGIEDGSAGKDNSRIVRLLLWLSLTAGLAVSVFTVVEELCLATACRDTASFTFFGIGMVWLGIAYFSLVLILLSLRKKSHLLDIAFAAMVYSGIGAEIRLLWIQKFIIGSWCPLCVTICLALCAAAILLLIETAQDARSDRGSRKRLFIRIGFAVTMVAVGLATALLGVKTL